MNGVKTSVFKKERQSYVFQAKKKRKRKRGAVRKTYKAARHHNKVFMKQAQERERERCWNSCLPASPQKKTAAVCPTVDVSDLCLTTRREQKEEEEKSSRDFACFLTQHPLPSGTHSINTISLSFSLQKTNTFFFFSFRGGGGAVEFTHKMLEKGGQSLKEHHV